MTLHPWRAHPERAGPIPRVGSLHRDCGAPGPRTDPEGCDRPQAPPRAPRTFPVCLSRVHQQDISRPAADVWPVVTLQVQGKRGQQNSATRESDQEVRGRDETTKWPHGRDPGAPFPPPSLPGSSVTESEAGLCSADKTDQNSSGRCQTPGHTVQGHGRVEG